MHQQANNLAQVLATNMLSANGWGSPPVGSEYEMQNQRAALDATAYGRVPATRSLAGIGG